MEKHRGRHGNIIFFPENVEMAGLKSNPGEMGKTYGIIMGVSPSILGYHYFWKHPYIYIYINYL